MALSNSDKDVIEEIVKVDGACLDSNRCKRCPFRAICLPEFLNTVVPSRLQRLKMAQDVLAHHYLIDEEANLEFQWEKK
jgi:hypothetical protein